MVFQGRRGSQGGVSEEELVSSLRIMMKRIDKEAGLMEQSETIGVNNTASV